MLVHARLGVCLHVCDGLNCASECGLTWQQGHCRWTALPRRGHTGLGGPDLTVTGVLLKEHPQRAARGAGLARDPTNRSGLSILGESPGHPLPPAPPGQLGPADTSVLDVWPRDRETVRFAVSEPPAAPRPQCSISGGHDTGAWCGVPPRRPRALETGLRGHRRSTLSPPAEF